MRRVFQYMAFVTLCCAALVSSCQRSEIPEPEIPEQETLPSQLKVNFSIGFEASDTKAIKTAWENGDVVFVFFNGVTTNGSGAAKYLKLTWNSSNSSWTSTPMNGLTASDLAASAAKTLTAVYLPFSGNATVNYNSSKGFTFDPSPSSLFWHSRPTGYILEASAADVNTTVLSLLNLGEYLAMTLPDGFIQFFLDDENATAQAASDIFITTYRVRAGGIESVQANGAVTISRDKGIRLPAFLYDKQNKASGESKGYLFSGFVPEEHRNVDSYLYITYFDLESGYRRSIYRDQATLYSSGVSRAKKLPPLSEWKDVGDIPGIFSLSTTKRVQFARGHVVVDVTNVGGQNHFDWKFAPEQYTRYGHMPTQTVPVVEAGKTVSLELFRWATAGVKNPGGEYGADPGHRYYMPNACNYLDVYGIQGENYTKEVIPGTPGLYNLYWIGPSSNENSWSTAGIPFEGLSWQDYPEIMKYCDWGVHYDLAGRGYDPPRDEDFGFWFTPSREEWFYVLRERPGASSKYTSRAAIYDAEKGMYIYGAILLPDDFELPVGCSFTPGIGTYYDITEGAPEKWVEDDSFDEGGYWTTDYDAIGPSWWQDMVVNRYYTAEATKSYGPSGSWLEMELAGAVFLPALGDGTIGSDGKYGQYEFNYDQQTGQYTDEYGKTVYPSQGSYWTSSCGHSGYDDQNWEPSKWTSEMEFQLYFQPMLHGKTHTGLPTWRSFFHAVRLVHQVN